MHTGDARIVAEFDALVPDLIRCVKSEPRKAALVVVPVRLSVVPGLALATFDTEADRFIQVEINGKTIRLPD